MKISQAFNEYIRDYLSIKSVHKNVFATFRTTRDFFVEIVGDKDIESISFEDVSVFLSNVRTHRGYKRAINTSASYITCLRTILRYWKLRGMNVIEYSLIPIPKREPRVPSFLTEEEVSKMISCAESYRDKAVISILYGSGLRISELKNLNRDIIKYDSYSVIGKGSKARICFLDVRTREYLSKYLKRRRDGSEALISSRTGERLGVQTIRYIVEHTAKEAGIAKKVTPHTLRHSFATNYMRNNGNIRSLSAMLGHANIQTTTIYTHITNNDLRREYMRYHTC